MQIIFPCYPGRPKEPDPFYSREYKAAGIAGFKRALVETEIQFGGEVKIKNLIPGERCLYRGWLLKPHYYESLCKAVTDTGSTLLIDAGAYLHSYSLPLWYPKVEDYTAKTHWLSFGSAKHDYANFALSKFQEGPLLVKDYIKSRKEEWYEACYIPDVRDQENVTRVINNFLHIMGDNLYGGLVLRQFHQYKKIGFHPKSNMPLTNEHRFFLFNGKVFYQIPYWSEGFNLDDEAASKAPSVEFVEQVCKDVESPFFVADFAEREDISDQFDLIEINDGGAAGIPKDGDVQEFYNKFISAIGE